MPAGGGGQVKAAGLSDELLERIAFSTSAGVHAGPLAEYAVFGLLAGAKSLPRLLDQQRNAVWSERWTMGLISEQRILIVGLGSIGREAALKLKALGATVIGTSRRNTPIDGVDEIIDTASLADVVGSVDGIVVALPGTDATQGLLDQAFFDAVRPGTSFVNVGRGTVVDEPALLDALDAGRIGFAALDVVAKEPLDSTSPFWSHPRVLISPHTAALNAAEDRLIAELFAKNATRFLDGAPLINRVDTVEFY
jgi:phosphoglycerate dehydrogenase-like enzyme